MSDIRVGILIENKCDLPLLQRAAEILDHFEVAYELWHPSGQLSPQDVGDYVVEAQKRGIMVIVAVPHETASLAGIAASRTTLPVIGVPFDTSPLGGLGSLLPIVQMPSGIPVATMAIGTAGAKNACVLAAQILALQDPALQERIGQYRDAMAAKVEADGEQLRTLGYQAYMRNRQFNPDSK